MTRVEESADGTPLRGDPLEVLAAFLRLGITSFGGPIAHLGYFRDELVTRRRWLDDKRYADLVALRQFLPGPASSQVGFGLGYLRAGLLGAIAAFLAFTLPSAVLMTAFAFGAPLFEGRIGEGLLAGLKIVAVSIVAQAVWGWRRPSPLTVDGPGSPSSPRSPLCCRAVLVANSQQSSWEHWRVCSSVAKLTRSPSRSGSQSRGS